MKHDFIAPTILKAGADHMINRAASRDAPSGERSMAKTAHLFSILTGLPVTEKQGWQFMELLKMVRSTQGEFTIDDYEDGAAYCALAGEAAFNADRDSQPKPHGTITLTANDLAMMENNTAKLRSIAEVEDTSYGKPNDGSMVLGLQSEGADNIKLGGGTVSEASNHTRLGGKPGLSAHAADQLMRGHAGAGSGD